MSTPSSTLYVHPGWASADPWSYAGTTLASAAGTSAVVAVAFDVDSSEGQSLSRGTLQYSTNNGQSWTSYTAPVDGQGSYVSATGTLWRFLDQDAADDATPNTFSAHYKLANGSVVEMDTTVMVDDAPAGLVGAADTMLSTMHAGDTVDVLTPIDTGEPTGGRWVIDSQSQPGLFAISYNPATDSSAKLVIANPGELPASGLAASVTVHYYDAYQLDTNGNPIAGQGVASTLSYTVEAGSTTDLAGFSSEARIGTATDAYDANPAVATLSTGNFVTVWQGPDTVAGGAGAGLWAQLRDAGGNALGAAFALTPDGDAKLEGQPAVAALANGRYVVAYSELDGGVSKIAYRVVDANGTVGAEHVLDSGASGDAAMPTVTTLSDGSFAIGWRSGGEVHVQQAAAADGALIGSAQSFAALDSAFSPSISALKGGGYAVAWGEMNDGNVYEATSANHTAVIVNGDGDAASISTAAPLPHTTALANGGFVVSWDSYANDPYGFAISDIYFQVYDSSGHAVGAITQANVDSGGGRYDAAISALSDGSFVVTWEGSDYSGDGIFGRRFDAGGNPIDQHEFEINQVVAGNQTSPAVTALGNGGFATVWVDDNGSGNVGIDTRVLPPVGGVDTSQGTGTQSASSGDSGAPASGTPVSGTSAGGTSSTTSSGSSSVGSSAGSTVGSSGTSSGTSSGAGSTPVTTPTGVSGTGGSDLITAPHGASTIDGGSGTDTVVFSGASTGFTILKDVADTGYTVSDTLGDHATLLNVERLQFSDQMVALDINGDAGQAYRLYQAAFDRVPDKAGLGFWIAMMDQGVTLEQAANSFVASSEFTGLYGANSTDAQFVDALYANVLHRAPDSSGYDFWIQSIQVASRADVLVSFSESAENQAQVIGSIQNGIGYQHWG